MSDRTNPRWLLLIHQIPPDPAYLRVKIGRRLARMGAVALKNSVYVLPRSDGALEDFQWLRREIVESAGEATIIDAQLVDGLSDTEAEELFRSARDADYAAVAEQARDLGKQVRAKLSNEKRQTIETDVARVEQRVAEIAMIDFFGASGREAVSAVLRTVRARLAPPAAPPAADAIAESYSGRTWVTRMGIHVDRIASAWLIRRFIDDRAVFKFVAANGYVPEPGELRFDMFEAEFSHVGDLCTFEALCARMTLKEPGLPALAEIVHDIDLKDGKFARPETEGIAAQIAGIALLHRSDEERLARGAQLFDELLAYFARKKVEVRAEPLEKAKKGRK
jgi:hypothetical protein